MSQRKHLMAALADHGVTPDDYAKIEKARRLTDEVNAAIAAAGGTVAYAVTMVSTVPLRAEPSREITEGG
jgi:hypothetical protein